MAICYSLFVICFNAFLTSSLLVYCNGYNYILSCNLQEYHKLRVCLFMHENKLVKHMSDIIQEEREEKVRQSQHL